MRRRSSLAAVVTAVLVVLSCTFVSAQSASSISGSVLDSAGGSIPGAAVVVKNESGVSFEAVSNGEGLFNVPSVLAGRLYGLRLADRIQDRGGQGCPRAVGDAGLRQGRARSRPAVRDGERRGQLRADQHPDGDGVVDAECGPAQPHADADAERARTRSRSCRASTPPRPIASRGSTGCRSRSSASRSTASATTTISCARRTRSSRR